MTRPGIEPRSHGPLANTLLIWPMAVPSKKPKTHHFHENGRRIYFFHHIIFEVHLSDLSVFHCYSNKNREIVHKTNNTDILLQVDYFNQVLLKVAHKPKKC